MCVSVPFGLISVDAVPLVSVFLFGVLQEYLNSVVDTSFLICGEIYFVAAVYAWFLFFVVVIFSVMIRSSAMIVIVNT